LLLVQLSATYPLHGLIFGRVALANANKPDKVGSSFSVSLPKWANFYFAHHTSWAREEKEEDPHVTKIFNFLSEHNVAIPSSTRKLTIKFML